MNAHPMEILSKTMKTISCSSRKLWRTSNSST